MDNYRLPKTAGAREALAATFGADGHRLLQTVEAAPDQAWLREMPAIQKILAFYLADKGQPLTTAVPQ